MTPESVPMTAWEQGFIVVLFVLAILVLSGGVFAFIRWVLKWAREREDEWQKFISELRKDDLIQRQADQRRNADAVEGTQEVLTQMTTAMTAMTTSLERHDQQAKTILQVVNHIDEQITRPKTRKPAD